MTEMNKEKKDPIRNIAISLGILTIVLATMTILMTVNIIPTFNANRAPRLVNVGMGANDVPSQHILRVSGYVCNVGIETAYHTQIHVVGTYKQGGVAMDTYVDIGNGGIIYGGESSRVVTDVPYPSEDLGGWTITPVWTNTP